MMRPAGSAHQGLASWVLQRVSAVYLSGFLVYLVVRFGLAPIRDYAQWRAWFAHGPVRLAWALFFASLLVHAWIGMRSVYLDYAKPAAVRLAVSVATAAGLAALALWAADLLIRSAGP